MYNFVNCLQFNIRYEKVERPAPVGGAKTGWLGFRIIRPSGATCLPAD
jgi:hypothetical protein